jgi:hypothetical protein
MTREGDRKEEGYSERVMQAHKALGGRSDWGTLDRLAEIAEAMPGASTATIVAVFREERGER